MAKTWIDSEQIRDGDVRIQDLCTTVPGSAVVTKIVAGENIVLDYTGIDAGTGVVTINGQAGGGAPAATLVAVKANKLLTQIVKKNTWTKLVFGQEEYDTTSSFDFINGIFTVPASGIYQFIVNVRALATVNQSIAIYKNDLPYIQLLEAVNARLTNCSCNIHLQAGDTISAYVYMSAMATVSISDTSIMINGIYNGQL